MAVIYGTQGRDFLEGTGLDDVIQGWAKFGDQSTDLGDELIGGGGNDELSGGDSADLLSGEAGRGRLNGGGGRDRFEFSRNYARDTITDFKDDVDTIELNGTTLGVTSKTDALSHATVLNGDTVFTFDTGDVLIVQNIADPELLRDDIVIL